MTEFQAVLSLAPKPNDDADLERVAELALEALRTEAAGLALGPAARIDLDRRLVELELTVEASSASDVHHRIGLILVALERGGPFILRESKTSQVPTPGDARERELVCA